MTIPLQDDAIGNGSEPITLTLSLATGFAGENKIIGPDTNTITDVTNNQVTTITQHGYVTGDVVAIGGTNQAAVNGKWGITRLTDFIFTLDGNTFVGSATGGYAHLPLGITVDQVLVHDSSTVAGSTPFHIYDGTYTPGTTDPIFSGFLDPTDQSVIQDGVGRFRPAGLSVHSRNGLILNTDDTGSGNLVATVLYRTFI